MRRILLAATLLAGLPGAAWAGPTEIINFAAPLASDFVATNPTAGTTHLAVSDVTVTISGLFDNPLVSSGVMDLSADNTDAAVSVAGNALQHYAGSFCIASGAGCSGTVYLQGSFTDAAFGALAGDGLTVNVANPPESLTLSSAVIPAADLVPPSAFDLSMSALAPPLSITDGTITAFTASYTGDASASAAVPEPASLAVLGLAMAGIAVVRRRAA